MDEGWSASVEAEQGNDGLFVPALILIGPERDPMRVPLAGVYRTAEDAIKAGREAIRAMSADSMHHQLMVTTSLGGLEWTPKLKGL